MEPGEIIAKVRCIVHSVKGDYIVTEAKGYKDSVTFAVSAWPEGIPLPKCGERVVLSGVAYIDAKGWRAEKARPFTKEDQ